MIRPVFARFRSPSPQLLLFSAALPAFVGLAACAAAQEPVVDGASVTRPVESRPLLSGGAVERAANGARLIVLVVVDQMSAEVYAGARPYFGPDGFARLEREGASFPLCAFEHACTETAPGHATIATGAPPSVHGIVANDWPDPRTGEAVNSVYGKDVPALGPPLGAKTKGARLTQLRAPTFGDALKAAAGPQAKSAGFSLKARSSLLSTGRSADVAAWLDYETGWWTSSPDHGDALPGFLAEFNARDAVSLLFDGEWIREGPDAAYALLGDDASPFERGLDGRSAFPHRLRGPDGSTRERSAETALSSPEGNRLVLEAAYAGMRALELGRDDVPDFLFVGFSANDLIGHQFGPWSHEVRAGMLAADRQLAEFMRKLDADVGRGRWMMAVTADHGVGPIPEAAVKAGLPAGRIDARKVRAAAESALVGAFGDPGPRTYVKTAWGYHCLFDREWLAERRIDSAVAATIAAAAIESVPGIARAVPTAELLQRGARDGLEAAVLKNAPPDRIADLWVLPKPYHLFSLNAASHGTPYAYDRRVPLLLFGPGIKAGFVGRGAASPGAAVTTLAAAIGISGPAMAEAPALTEALQ